MRYFRCPDHLWEAASRLAQERDTSVSRELVRFLELYTGVPAEVSERR
jgi:hypothetical protein